MGRTAWRDDEFPATEVCKPRLQGYLAETWQRSSFTQGLRGPSQLPAESVPGRTSDWTEGP